MVNGRVPMINNNKTLFFWKSIFLMGQFEKLQAKIFLFKTMVQTQLNSSFPILKKVIKKIQRCFSPFKNCFSERILWVLSSLLLFFLSRVGEWRPQMRRFLRNFEAPSQIFPQYKVFSFEKFRIFRRLVWNKRSKQIQFSKMKAKQNSKLNFKMD